MKKEYFITALIISALAACAFLSNGCSSGTTHSSLSICPGASFSEQDLYIYSKLANMEPTSDCLTAIGCAAFQGSRDCCGNTDGKYYGCIDCFGFTASDTDNVMDYYSVSKLCNGCYCVNFPIVESDGDVKPVYGIMTNVD